MTPLSLPPNPKLEALKKQAKAIQKAHKTNDASCCEVLRNLNRFAKTGDAEILAAEVPLKQVQFALAMDYGFASWTAMKSHVESVAAELDETPEASPSEDPQSRLLVKAAPQPGGFQAFHWCPFSDCLHSCMIALGEDAPYDFLLGVSGSAWRLRWNANRWDLGNIGIMHTAVDATAPFREAFDALGYECEFLARPKWASEHGISRSESDEAVWHRHIVNTLSAGKPLIALGVLGPPEASVIAGCEDAGELLIGWSMFADPENFPEQDFDSAGRFRKREWFTNTHMLIRIGEKRSRPPLAQTVRRALEWLATVARTPRVRSHLGGPAAFDAWAEAVLRDADFPEDLGILRERLLTIHDAMCMVNQRERGARFLRQAAEVLPAAGQHLHAAATCYDQENGLLGGIHKATGGYIPPHDSSRLPELRNPEARRKMAEVIRQARDKDIEAVTHIETALRA